MTSCCAMLTAFLLCISPFLEVVAVEQVHDFVIVGGGLAGCVLANRLSESGQHSVLLLNLAGAPPKAYSGPVVLSDEFIMKTNLSASPGISATILQPGYAPVPRFSTDLTGSSPARMLGGSSLVGLSLYLRDHPEALNSWGEGWSWEELSPYFDRAEGPYKVQGSKSPAYVHPLTQEFVRGAEAAGLPWVPDLNTESGEGVGITPTTQRVDGSKMQAFDSYLRPALVRPNLKVLHGVRADRLLVSDGRCHGVAFRRLSDSSDHVVHARNEVLLSSGYIYSPRLLFLSGIGAKVDLEAVGLKVVKDLPAVGRNLTAARFSPLAWRTETPTLARMVGTPISPAGERTVVAAYGSAVLEATARVRSGSAAKADPESRRPDIVLSFMPLFYAAKSAPMQYSLMGEPWPLKTNAYTILATLGETKAQGSVTFQSGAPDVSPVVTHEAMTHPEDLARAQEAAIWARQIGSSASFSPPGQPTDEDAASPAMWSAVYDGRGTCRMGKDDQTSVVDLELRVHGIKGLRVVDGSSIPVGSPYFAVPEVLMLAERASDLILQSHGKRNEAIRPVSLLVEPMQTVTIPGLSHSLGSHFTLMEAVTYLSAPEAGMLLETPGVNPQGARTVLYVSLTFIATTLVALACRGRGKAEEEGAHYLLA